MNFQSATITPAESDCIRIAQLTDTHLLPAGHRQFKGLDTARTLEQVIASINAEAERPDLVLATGDLAHEPLPEVYMRLRDILRQANYPVFCLPGNHDVPELMHDILNGGSLSTVKSLDCGGWRIILLNSVVAGKEHGHVSDAELRFLEQQLQARTAAHVLIALHHHPVDIGSPWMDAMKVTNGGEFLAIVRRFPQVRGVLWGHIHQDFHSQLGTVQLIGSPSTCLQFRPRTQQFEKDMLPPAYRKLNLHGNGDITTALQWLEQPLAHDSVSWE